MLCNGFTIPQKRQFLFNVTFYMYMYKILYKEYSNYSKKHCILPQSVKVFVKVVLKGDN